MKSPKQSELAARCEARLREFTAADSADLTEFAECRLIVHGISPCNGEDVTQRALQLVLQGLEAEEWIAGQSRISFPKSDMACSSLANTRFFWAFLL